MRSAVNEWWALLNHTSAYVSIRQHTNVKTRNLMMRSRMNEFLALLNMESGTMYSTSTPRNITHTINHRQTSLVLWLMLPTCCVLFHISLHARGAWKVHISLHTRGAWTVCGGVSSGIVQGLWNNCFWHSALLEYFFFSFIFSNSSSILQRCRRDMASWQNTQKYFGNM